MPRATLDSIMVFVLDNYDSFTYNLVQYLGELGAEVEVYRNDELTVEQVEALKPERILLSPGPCTPGEAGILVPLIRHMAGKAPILGVCLGHQAIGEAFGGQVVRAQHLMRRQGRVCRAADAADVHAVPLPDCGGGRAAGGADGDGADGGEWRDFRHYGHAAPDAAD